MNGFNFDRYKWREDEEIPGRYKREAGGGELIEDVWNLMKQGEQNLFIGVYATLSDALDSTKLLTLVRNAWVSLRWDVPTVAAQTLHVWHDGPLPTTFITYDVVRSATEVEEWANATVEFSEGFKDLDELRYVVGQDPIPSKDLVPQTLLYVVPFSPTSFGILLRTSHITFDGAGVKIMMTRLFNHLTRYITDSTYPTVQTREMKWGTEANHLLPIITEILRKYEPGVQDTEGNVIKAEVLEEPRQGPKYTETLTDIMTKLATGGPLSHPFKSFIEPPLDGRTSKPRTRRLQHTFSIDESIKIKAAGAVGGSVKEKLTVNHLLHGALSLLPIIDNPPAQDSDGVVFYYGLIDGRQRLAKEYRGPLDYPGYCLGMSPVQIPISVYHKLPRDDTKTLVLTFAMVIQAEYKKQAEYPSLIAVEPQQVEMMLSVPPPPPWCGPAYSADGRGHTYLYPKYPQTGRTTIEITDFFVGLNKCDPGPFFRATEWNGRIILSADFNELAIERKVVEGWMEKWAKLLLTLTV